MEMLIKYCKRVSGLWSDQSKPSTQFDRSMNGNKERGGSESEILCSHVHLGMSVYVSCKSQVLWRILPLCIGKFSMYFMFNAYVRNIPSHMHRWDYLCWGEKEAWSFVVVLLTVILSSKRNKGYVYLPTYYTWLV